MNSEQISLISKHPFIRKFIAEIVEPIEYRRIRRVDKQTIHSDLVPKFSRQIIEASLGPDVTEKDVVIKEPGPEPIKDSLMAPLIKQVPTRAPVQPAPTRVSDPDPLPGYGRIIPLLQDPSVIGIDCPGPGRAIIVNRYGQRQITRIALGSREILAILDEIANQAHIPLIEGVFRAAVDNFSVSAVVSETLGSKFVIRKQMV